MRLQGVCLARDVCTAYDIIISVGRVSTERGELQCGAVCGMADDASVVLAACNINRAVQQQQLLQRQSDSGRVSDVS